MKHTVTWKLGVQFKEDIVGKMLYSIFLLCVWLLQHMEVTDLRIFKYNPIFLKWYYIEINSYTRRQPDVIRANTKCNIHCDSSRINIVDIAGIHT